MYQNPDLCMMDLLQSEDFSYARSEEVSDKAEGNFVEFTL